MFFKYYCLFGEIIIRSCGLIITLKDVFVKQKEYVYFSRYRDLKWLLKTYQISV